MTAVLPDSWDEIALIGIRYDDDGIGTGGTEAQFAAITEDITAMDWGEKEIEGVPTLSGGRIVKRTPMTDESITLKMYPVEATLDASGIIQWFHPQVAVATPKVSTGTISNDTSPPMAVYNSNLRRKHKIIIIWATGFPATAGAVTVSGQQAYRIQIVNAYLTKVVPSYDDKQLSVEATFKWAPFNKAGSPNKVEESTAGNTAVLPATTSSVTAL